MLPYGTRVERFTLAVNRATGQISSFQVAQTVTFTNAGSPFNGLAPSPASVLGNAFDPEGFAISPDGKYAYAALQSAMVDEGGKDGTYTRLVKFDVATGEAVGQFD